MKCDPASNAQFTFLVNTHTPFPFEFWDHKLLLLILTLYILVVVLTAILYSSQRASMSNTSLRLLHRVIGWTHSRLMCHMKWVLENAAQKDLSKRPCFRKHGVVWPSLVVPEITERVREDFFFFSKTLGACLFHGAECCLSPACPVSFAVCSA